MSSVYCMLMLGPPIIIPGRSCLLRITLLYKPDENKLSLYIHLTHIIFMGRGITFSTPQSYLKTTIYFLYLFLELKSEYCSKAHYATSNAI